MKDSSDSRQGQGNNRTGVIKSRSVKERIRDELSQPVPNVLLLQRLRGMRLAAKDKQQTVDSAGRLAAAT